MSASKRFLHPDAIRRITRLDLRAKQIVEGFLSGTHRSPFFGQSIEFLQHREYVPGDDLRHVDWKVWARQDRLYVKQFEEETNLRCYLLVDRSRSMEYVNRSYSKYEYGCTLAACLGYLVLKQQDAIGGITFDNQVRDVVPVSNSQKQLSNFVDSLAETTERDASNWESIFAKATEIFPRKGMMLIFSDMFGEVSQMLRGLRLLCQAGHDVAVIHVLDDDELDFEFEGPVRFEDLESPGQLACNPKALRAGYLDAVQEFLQQIRHGIVAAGIQYKLVRTSQNFGAVLSEFLTERLAKNRH
jgi:uncharacterized protein (DUF58 family)